MNRCIARWLRPVQKSGDKSPHSKGILPRTLRWSLAWMVLAVVGPLILVQGGVYFAWYQAARADELQSNLEMARAVAVATDAYLRDVYRQEGAIGGALVGLKPYTSKQLSDFLTRTAAEYEAVRRWRWLSPEGMTIASSQPEFVGQSLAALPQFHELRAGRSRIVSDIYKSPVDGQPAVLIGRRIVNQRGTLEGFLVATVDPHRLGEVALRLDRSQQGAFTVFDRQGTLVYVYPEIDWTSLDPRWRRGDPVLDEALQEGREAFGEIVSLVDGQRRFGARVPVADTGWVAGASRPVSTAMATFQQSLRMALLANAAVGALGLALAVAFGRRITAALGALQTHARELGAGQPPHPVAAARLDEFARLGEAFNLMAEQVEDRRQAAERALAEVRRSNQELEQFAYVASHDLQEPLRVISGYLQLIERRYKDRLDSDANEFINFTVEAAKRLQQLINDLMLYSRVGSRGKPLLPTPAEVPLREALAALEQAIAESGARVTHDALPVVLADGGQLAQLFQNLIANAVKFRGPHPPEIHVSAQRDAGQWRLSVRDNGIGIESGYWERIFLIFQRLHTRQEYPGTGIGLAVCKRIVERHGGRIWVESQAGAGSTFFFTLADAARET